MLTPQPHAALEYWFFKVNSGPVALLVDWIARRKRNELMLRVSVHSPQHRAVYFEKLAPALISEQTFISAQRTAGQLGDVAWELNIECQDEWIKPGIFPANLLRMTDLTILSAPLAAFSGWVRHGTAHAELQRAPGLLSHYWGRQLAHDWWWVSANQFDRNEVAVECAVSHSGLWGIPLRLPLAYLYLRYGDVRRLMISPPAIVQVKGSPDKFEIHFRRLSAEPIILRAWGRDYGDLGEAIINTLVGDLEIWEGDRRIARAEGTAALERRAPGATS